MIWTSAGLLSIRPLGTYFDEIWFKIKQISLKKINLELYAKWRLFCLGLEVLMVPRTTDDTIHQNLYASPVGTPMCWLIIRIYFWFEERNLHKMHNSMKAHMNINVVSTLHGYGDYVDMAVIICLLIDPIITYSCASGLSMFDGLHYRHFIAVN